MTKRKPSSKTSGSGAVPNPESPENEFKEEYYRRIAYANEQYASGIPGWKTDRGRVYIMYGPPDDIDSHPSGGMYNRPMSEGGGDTAALIPSKTGATATLRESAKT